MPQRCKVCSDIRRLQIDRDLVRDGSNVSAIARKYDLPYPTMHRHQKKHLSRQLLVAHQQKELVNSTDLANELTDLFSKAKDILNKAESEDRLGLALKAISEGRNVLESVFKVASYIFDAQREAERQSKQEQLENLKTLPTHDLERLQGILQKANSPESVIDLDSWDYEPERPKKKKRRKKIRFRIELDDEDEDDDFSIEDDFESEPDEELEPEDFIPKKSIADSHLLDVKRWREKESKGPRTFLDDAVKGSMKFKTLA